MLYHTIAMPATISTGAMMITASLISTTKEFTENTYNSIDIKYAASTTAPKNKSERRTRNK